MKSGIDASFNQNEGIFSSLTHTVSNVFDEGEQIVTEVVDSATRLARARTVARNVSIGLALGAVAWLVWRRS